MLMPKRVKYRRQQRGRMKGKANRGNVAASARMLNLTIRILHYKIGKLGITPALYR